MKIVNRYTVDAEELNNLLPRLVEHYSYKAYLTDCQGLRYLVVPLEGYMPEYTMGKHG